MVGDPDDVDVPEFLTLFEFDEALLVELEQSQESNDDLQSIDEIGGQPSERDATNPRQFIDEFGQGVGDVGFDDPHVEQIDLGLGFGCGGPQVGRVNVLGLHPFQEVGHQFGEPFVGSAHPRVTTIGVVGQGGEDPADVLERLALEQPGEEQVAFFPQGKFFVEIDVLATRKKSAGLQLHEGRGDQQELGGQFQIE